MWTVIYVARVQRQKVDVVENEALPIILLQRFFEANVEQLCSVEQGIPGLKQNDRDQVA